MKKNTKQKEKELSENDYTVIQTGVVCPNCDEILVSLSRQDFNSCKCGKVYVNGGF